LPTDFDWRIGVLNNRVIYACKYFMARNHWQIYNHASESSIGKTGSFACLGVHQVPKDVIRVDLQATRLVGVGLYGVDIKESSKGPVIIEINDNPSIDSGVEDEYLGDELYRIIMSDFFRRIED
jgi:glutathione synthase/RimK-type ligase-like ATP-grasp enzyme